jgi:hypothetical protein
MCKSGWLDARCVFPYVRVTWWKLRTKETTSVHLGVLNMRGFNWRVVGTMLGKRSYYFQPGVTTSKRAVGKQGLRTGSMSSAHTSKMFKVNWQGTGSREGSAGPQRRFGCAANCLYLTPWRQVLTHTHTHTHTKKT